MSLTVTTPASGLALTLDELKDSLGITHSADDARLERLVRSASAFLEKHCDITLLQTVYLLALPGFGVSRGETSDFWFQPVSAFDRGCGIVITIPRPPLVSVQTVKYYDAAGTLQTISSANYQVDIRSRPGRVAPLSTYTWPLPGTRLDPVEIAYTAGFGTDADSVPHDLRAALTMLVAHWNENREALIPGALNDVPLGFDELVAPYKYGSL